MGADRPEKSRTAEREEAIQKFWEDNDIFQKSLEKPSPKGEFVFYEGPPTANGLPGIHHIESRAYKDLFPRYKTMCGYHVRRKAGWDTHGLPVELEVEKELELSSKKEIEDYGIEKFNRKCRESVLRYVSEWDRFTQRIAFWLNQDEGYFTFQPSYMESVWHILQRIWKKGLLYKDYKVVPWCPRCGTALSSHELAQGYKDVIDTSVYVKFRLQNGQEFLNRTITPSKNVYLVAWTTTPWTLPGNLALAINEETDYVFFTYGKDDFIVAKSRAADIFGDDIRIDVTIKGKDLVGLEYEPLYPYLADDLPPEEKQKLPRAYKVYPANFVTTDEGTGIVHTAVMYGQDDFELGTTLDLPKHHLVGDDGKFKEVVREFAGKKVKDVDADIIADLKKQKVLFKEEPIEHTYPFCWRCKTPLIYYARDSYFIAVSKLRHKLIRENKKINWVPAHIKEGRFGEWLRDVKDWAVSRERYWGTPLPLWQCSSCDKQHVIGSVGELKERTVSSGNTYFVVRHGEAENNVKGLASSAVESSHGLTEKGVGDIEHMAKNIAREKIDIIISSPVRRTRETTEIIAKTLGIEPIYDERIREINMGVFEEKSWESYHETVNSMEDRFHSSPDGGESHFDVKRRVGEFLYDIEAKYKGKRILIVSHGSPISNMFSVACGADLKKSVAISESMEYEQYDEYLEKGEVRQLPFVPLPHNADYELDLHRPYIDDIKLTCSCSGEMKRTPEVVDVWFDAGSMPFAQDHYPFENKRWVNWKGYPADYIAEAIDQTRGWFYTLHVIGVLMKRKRAYENVICLGHILDEKGKKMSKSIGNIVEPNEQIRKYGADAIRFWMYSVNQPGESKNYDERMVDEVVKKVINIVDNVTKFYELYAGEAPHSVLGVSRSENVLDRWIVARFHELCSFVTQKLDAYEATEPARAIRDFVNDFSTWYIRRSRERFKADKSAFAKALADKQAALATTRYVLLEFSKLIAPMMPFIAEDIYRRVGGPEESVHLEEWPAGGSVDASVLKNMEEVRRIVSRGLEARASAGIKVRQPLASLKIKSQKSKVEDNSELVQLIKDEVNVKEVVFETADEFDVALDTELSPELVKEGHLRELIRAVQGVRKDAKLTPGERAVLVVETNEEGGRFVKEYEKEITETAALEHIEFGSVSGGNDIALGDIKMTVGIQK